MTTNVLSLSNAVGTIELVALVDIVDGKIFVKKNWISLDFYKVNLEKGKTKHIDSWEASDFCIRFLKQAHKCYKMGKDFSKLLDKHIAEEEKNGDKVRKVLEENEEFLSELYLEIKKIKLN